MRDARRVIVGIVCVLYLILIIKKINISKPMYVFLIGIILANQALEEWNRYLETNNKFYLFIPIASVIIIVFSIIQLI